MPEDRRGHIKVARKFFEDDVWWNEPRFYSKAEAWLWCINRACYGPYEHTTNLGVIHLERGEFVASVRLMAEQFGWHLSVVHRWLKTAKDMGRLAEKQENAEQNEVRTLNRTAVRTLNRTAILREGTVYLIVNYDYWQTSRPGRGRAGERRGEHSGEHSGERKENAQENKREAVISTNTELPNGNSAPGDRRKAGRSKSPEPRPETRIGKAHDIMLKHIGKFPHGRIAKALTPVFDHHHDDELVLKALDRWCERAMRGDERPEFITPERFAQVSSAAIDWITPGSGLRGTPYEALK